MFKINNLANQTSHIVTEQKGIFSIVEHNVDFSVAPCNAMEEYYMSQMNVKRKQAIANLNAYVVRKGQALSDYACDPKGWRRKCLVNIAKAGMFSSDRTIAEYDRDIWHLGE